MGEKEEHKRGRGRPLKDDGRRGKDCRVRLNDSEMLMLDELMEKRGINKSEAIRRALSVCYNIEFRGR